MESSAICLETVIHRKILLYQDLVQVLNQEKKSLRETDVDVLWRFTEKKQAIAEKIETERKEILSLLNKLKINHGMGLPSFSLEKALGLMTAETGRDFKKELLSLKRVKKQVHDMAKANKAFVEEYLNVLDEMIGIIANAGHQDTGYTRSCRSDAGGKANLLLHKEV